MGLGDRGQKRIKVDNSPKVDDLFKPTEGLADAAAEDVERKIGRPKGGPVKPKTFSLPLELNQRLRLYAFEKECSEVDVVRAALEAFLDAQDGTVKK